MGERERGEKKHEIHTLITVLKLPLSQKLDGCFCYDCECGLHLFQRCYFVNMMPPLVPSVPINISQTVWHNFILFGINRSVFPQTDYMPSESFCLTPTLMKWQALNDAVDFYRLKIRGKYSSIAEKNQPHISRSFNTRTRIQL